ncbi:M28 family metallopeptidase [Solirubrobacter taibaiensis]|nr:M28 family metallopeptidase [Solirubrobacter taibaiensis]
MLAALLCTAALIGCGGDAAEPTTSAPDPREPVPEASEAAASRLADRFDEDRAWKLLEYQVKIGPRPAGSPQLKQLATYIKNRIPRGRLEAVPGGLQNVVGEIPGKGKAIVVGAHYDTKDIPDFVGANDGAGGTAAVMEIARVMRTMKRPANARPIKFVFFDGEEATDDSDFLGTGVRGAKAYANKYAKSTAKLILLDFVADKDLAIPREQTSDEEMWANLRAAAKRVGALSAFPDEEQGGVQDDHTPFVQKGIPSIDLIDFDFPCWHQTCDDLTAVSKKSLNLSGEAVLEYVTTEWKSKA